MIRRLRALWRGPGRLAALAVAVASCAAQAESGPARPLTPGEKVVELGPTKAQRDSNAPLLEFPFVARADEALTGARVRLAFDSSNLGLPRGGGIEVLVNEERVALLSADDLRKPRALRELPVDSEVLADRNLLTLRVVDEEGRCSAEARPWHKLESVAVVVQASPVALPNELALLPLPFFDVGFDSNATIPVVLAQLPTPDYVRLAAMVASWFAVDAPLPLNFTTEIGSLPDSRAIVLVSGAADAAVLGLEEPTGPEVRMIDHPAHPESNVKLLIIEGRDLPELRVAVESLAARNDKLVGPEVRLRAPPPQPPAAPYSAPRWVPSGRPVRFASYPTGSVFVHEGSTPGTLSVRFRVAPDLWIWPAEFVDLDLGWTEHLPAGATAPRLDVEMNGYFLATLPQPNRNGDSSGRVRLRVPREHMRAFNQMLVHVHYPESDPCGAPVSGGSRSDAPRVAIARDSVLHVERFGHFSSVNDVLLFAFDGFPFSRVPDLGETAVVVPEQPAPSEMSMVLSVFGRIAQITGRTATRATFVSGKSVDGELRDKDLLVIGGHRDNPLLAKWESQLPIAVDGDHPHIQRRMDASFFVDLLGGLGPLEDLRRAKHVLSQAKDVAAMTAIESPLTRGRTAVVVTATDPASLPPLGTFLGYAESRALTGDLLLVSGGDRWLFRIGTTIGRGQLDDWTRLRWFLATHWVALLPVLLAGVWLLALRSRRYFARRMQARLEAGVAA
jgi:Bacterial cellulose synthase subunit